MEKKFLAIPIILILIIIIFLGFSFFNYNNLRYSVFYPQGSYSPNLIILAAATQAELNEPVEVFIELYPGALLKENMIGNYYGMSWIDEDLPVFYFNDLIKKNKKIEVSLIGAVKKDESFGAYLENQDGDYSTYYTAKIICQEEIDFVKELELKQKNCTAEISLSNEQDYLDNFSVTEEILNEFTSDEINEVLLEIKNVENNFELSFLEYVLNPVAAENKVKKTNEEVSQLSNKLFAVILGPETKPQEGLDEVVGFMSNKNLDFVVIGRSFDLNDEISFSTDYNVVLSESLQKYEGEGLNLLKEEKYTLKNTWGYSFYLSFIVKKLNDNYTVTISRT